MPQLSQAQQAALTALMSGLEQLPVAGKAWALEAVRVSEALTAVRDEVGPLAPLLVRPLYQVHSQLKTVRQAQAQLANQVLELLLALKEALPVEPPAEH